MKNDDVNEFFTSRQDYKAWSTYFIGFENGVRAKTQS